MATQDALVAVFSRNAFFKRLHYLALAAFLLAFIVIIFLVWILFFLIRNPTNPLYFATDNAGRLIEVIPVDRPNMSTEAVMAWTIEAVQAAYAYDFINYRGQLQSAQKYFTNYGWNNYMQALTSSNNLLALTQRKQMIIAKVVDQPKIITEGILAGAYAWKFEMPLLVSYWEPPYDKPAFSNALVVSAIVQRQPILKSYQGLGVLQLIASMPASTSNQPQELSDTPTG